MSKINVGAAREWLQRISKHREQVGERVRADGRVSKPERAHLANATRQKALAGMRLELAKAERAVNRLRRDAFQDGQLSAPEQASIQDAQAKLQNVATSLLNRRAADREIDASDVAKGYRSKDGQWRDGKGGPTELVLSSFNVTGSSHTGPGGEHPELESGRARMRYVAKLMKKHKVDVVGFQELQADQLQEFRKLTQGEFGVYPGFKLGRGESVNSIAWRKDKWELVKPGSISSPYFNGQKRQMPVVLLRNKQTGQKAYFANFHNPADTKRFHNQERFRDAAARLQANLADRLRKRTGLPVFITGDMNEHAEYRRHIQRGSSLHAAGKGKRAVIDWIFGSPDVKFSDYVRDRSRLVRQTTNHGMIVARARIRPGKS